MFEQRHHSTKPGDTCNFYLVLFDRGGTQFDLG